MENLVMGLTSAAADVVASSSEKRLKSHTWFQWGGTLSAIFLLILNQARRRSHTQTSLLVFYLLTSFPTVLFNILRGEFGYWVAFLAVAAHLFFPRSFPASRFVLFVIIPNWVAHGLRDTIAGGVLCLIIGILLFIEEIRGIGCCDNGEYDLSCGNSNCNCDLLCFCYHLGIGFLIFFTILYL